MARFTSGQMTKSSMPSMAKSGVKLWEFETGDIVDLLPRHRILMARFTSGHMTHKLYAINGKSGVKLWEFETGNSQRRGVYGVRSSPVIGSDGTVYAGVTGQKALYHQWQEWGQAMGISKRGF